AVKLADGGAGHPNRGLVAQYLDVVPEILRREDDIPGLHAVWLRGVLIVPGQLALGDEPGLILQVVVIVVGVARCLADHSHRELIGDDDALGPRRGPLALLDLGNSRGKGVLVQNEARKHQVLLEARLAAWRPGHYSENEAASIGIAGDRWAATAFSRPD